MRNIIAFKQIAMGALLVGSLLGTSCSSDYMDTVPTENVSAITIGESLNNVYLALNGIHRKMVSQDLGSQGMGGEPGLIICREAHGDDMTWDSQSWHKVCLNWSANTNPTNTYSKRFMGAIL